MSRTRQWLLAIRPKTLTISIAPVMTGSALAWAVLGRIDWLTAVAALGSALLIQIGTNLYNDAADFERGADTPGRLGPERATAQGWFSADEVKWAAILSFGLAFLAGNIKPIARRIARYIASENTSPGGPFPAFGICGITRGRGRFRCFTDTRCRFRFSRR